MQCGMEVYSSSGTYIDTFKLISCDSVVTMEMTINNSIATNDSGGDNRVE